MSIQTKSTKRLPPHAEQCFLMQNIAKYSWQKGNMIKQDFRFFATLKPKEDTVAFLQKVKGRGTTSQTLFENMPKTIAGDLQTYFRLFKVIPYKQGEKKSNDKDINIPMPFNNIKLDPGKDFASPNQKLGVAFRSFSFDFEGKRPVEVDAYVMCNLRLYFESSQDLLEKYSHPYK